jgi:hypothetical protein
MLRIFIVFQRELKNTNITITLEFMISHLSFFLYSRETKIIIDATLVGTYPTGRPSNLLTKKLRALRSAWDEEEYTKFATELLNLRKIKAVENQKKGLEPNNREDLKEEQELMKKLKFKPMMSNQISIAHDYFRQEIRIATGAGRLLRPLYVVEKNVLKLKKYIKYAQVQEEDSLGEVS